MDLEEFISMKIESVDDLRTLSLFHNHLTCQRDEAFFSLVAVIFLLYGLVTKENK